MKSEKIVTVDGVESLDGSIQLVDDRREHSAEVRLSLRTT